MTDTPAEMPTAKEVETTVYGVECPSCGQWHEHNNSQINKTVGCICGTKFKVIR